jgi:uncharacterized damage-inducible protein DinB
MARLTYAQLFVEELDAEADTTRRFLARVPADQLTWRPHEKSNTAGTLALHIAKAIGGISNMAIVSEFAIDQGGPQFDQPTSLEQILSEFDKGVALARQRLASISDEEYDSVWKLTMAGKPMMTMPRRQMVRALMFNHIYQHRGQLGVYLRLMGVNVPYSYGPSADEMPPMFA